MSTARFVVTAGLVIVGIISAGIALSALYTVDHPIRAPAAFWRSESRPH